MDAVDVSAVQANGVGTLCSTVLEAEEIVGHLWRSSHLAGTVKTQNEQVHHQAIVLHNEGGKLQAPDDAVRVGVVHVLERGKNKLNHAWLITILVSNMDFHYNRNQLKKKHLHINWLLITFGH